MPAAHPTRVPLFAAETHVSCKKPERTIVGNATFNPPPGRAMPSQPMQDLPFPLHTPQTSKRALLNGMPSHPTHMFDPPHTPHRSYSVPLFGTPSHPAHARPFPPHTPQTSAWHRTQLCQRLESHLPLNKIRSKIAELTGAATRKVLLSAALSGLSME